MTIRSRNLLCIVLAVAALAVTGCKDGPVEPPCPPPPHTLPIPDTPDQLMANFVMVYEQMDIHTYRDEVLADAYDFVLQMETVEQFGLSDNLLDHADELAIANKMFSGQPNAEGKVLSAIEIQSLRPQGAWAPVPEVDPYFGDIPGALVRNYNVLIYFNMVGDFRYQVQGDQLFYVAPDTVMYDGEMTPRYRLRGQVDQSWVIGAKATEGTAWGAVKVLFQ